MRQRRIRDMKSADKTGWALQAVEGGTDLPCLAGGRFGEERRS